MDDERLYEDEKLIIENGQNNYRFVNLISRMISI